MNPNHYPIWIPVVNTNYWEVSISAIMIGGKPVEACQAKPDHHEKGKKGEPRESVELKGLVPFSQAAVIPPVRFKQDDLEEEPSIRYIKNLVEYNY